jgi:hypothetical protein
VHWHILVERDNEIQERETRGSLMIEAVIYDFHGTLTDVREILPLVRARKYDEFYEASLSCPPIESVVLAAKHSAEAGYANLLLTGMPERHREGLEEWLRLHGVPVSLLMMRMPQDGYRKDFVIKARMYSELLDKGYYVMRAFEDSPAVSDLWRRQGIPVKEMPRHPLTFGVDKPIATS